MATTKTGEGADRHRPTASGDIGWAIDGSPTPGQRSAWSCWVRARWAAIERIWAPAPRAGAVWLPSEQMRGGE